MNQELSITIDYGTSMVRAIYRYPSQKYNGANGITKDRLLLMQPNILLINNCLVEKYSQKQSGARPENNAWVEIGEDGEELPSKTYAVGLFVENIVAANNHHLEITKHNNALVFVAAVIGAIAKRHYLKNRLSVNLMMLLPYNEYELREVLHRGIENVLREFKFCGSTYSVEITSIKTAFEGYGLLCRGRSTNKDARLQKAGDLVLGILMIGYRDASLIVFVRGNPIIHEVNQFGMYKLLALIANGCSAQPTAALARALCRYQKAKTEEAKHLALKPVLQTNRSVLMQETERKNLEEAISQSLSQYIHIISNYLQMKLSSCHVDEWLIGGGTACYLGNRLSSILLSIARTNQMPLPKIEWGTQLEKVARVLFEEQIKCEGLEYRLSDLIGAHYTHLNEQLPKVLPVAKTRKRQTKRVDGVV
jgi:hypothetical protein